MTWLRNIGNFYKPSVIDWNAVGPKTIRVVPEHFVVHILHQISKGSSNVLVTSVHVLQVILKSDDGVLISLLIRSG